MVIMDKVVKGKVTREPEKAIPKPSEKIVIEESEEDKPKQRNKKK